MDKVDTMDGEKLIPKHGGFRKLKSFQLAELVYDLTVRFCNSYIDPRSRTHDQMVQAARSGARNIVEGSQASGTSKKMEMKLTGVARASLEELRLDYESYLRQQNLTLWEKHDPRRQNLVDRRPKTESEIADWARSIRFATTFTASIKPSMSYPSDPSTPPPGFPEILANAALTLIAVASALLDRQLDSQARAFERDGGFTERLYGSRSAKRKDT